MGQVKKINIKNRGCYFCDDMINIKNLTLKPIKNRQEVARRH